MRDRVCSEMKELETSAPESFLNAAVDCHLRQIEQGGGGGMDSAKKSGECRLCEVHGSIELYENLIFKFVKGEKSQLELKHVREAVGTKDRAQLEEKGVILHERLRRGTWGDSEAERLLRAMLKFARSSSAGSLGIRHDVLEDGATHMK